MKVTLIRPPKLMVEGSIGTGANTTSSIYPTAPLGLAFIAGSVRHAGHDVTVIDGIGDGPGQMNVVDIPLNGVTLADGLSIKTSGLSPQQILARIPEDTAVIGISCMFTHNWLADRALLGYLAAHLPNAVFIAGGESITGMGNISLEQAACLKVCVLGEGEETIIDLLKCIETGDDLSTVKGILYKDALGAIHKSARRERMRQLDTLPLPAWDLFPVDSYEKQGRFSGDEQRVSLPILATRGCPYTCTFCTSPDMWGTRYFMRTPVNVANEMEMMKEKYNVTNFEFYDLTAIIQKKWIIELSKLIIERNLNVYWRIPSGTRSEAIDEEVAYYLIKSGCYTMTYAPESGSPRLLELIHKQVRIPSMLKSMRAASGQGVKLYINMIQGLPEEKHADVFKTMWFLMRCAMAGVDELSLGTFRPYPGTVLFNRLVEEGKIQFTTDEFFINTILAVETEESCYNDNVHPVFYRFYNKFMYSLFFGTVYASKPRKFVKAVRNILNNNSDTRFERIILFYLQRAKMRMAALF